MVEQDYLLSQAVERFADYRDLDENNCTIEEREEFEPLIDRGVVVYAGVDYERILRNAEQEADVVIWDGGNNDLPFYLPDVHIVLVDPHRPGHEMSFHPGEANLRMADVVIMNKIETATPEGIQTVRENVRKLNPAATLIEAASPITVEDPTVIQGKTVLVVEDGPTLTHGGMTYGAGVITAKKYGCKLVDPRQYAVGTIKGTFQKYPGIGTLLPAMGYGGQQVRDLEATVAATPCDAVIIATPIDLRRIINIRQTSVRVKYELQEIGRPTLDDVLAGLRKRQAPSHFAGARWAGERQTQGQMLPITATNGGGADFHTRYAPAEHTGPSTPNAGGGQWDAGGGNWGNENKRGWGQR